MKKAFIVNGGAGRVLCSIPALEYYVKHVDQDAIIVSEAWTELFLASDVLRNNVYPIHHRHLVKDILHDREVVSPEPYRLNAFFNQKANLIQAFDMLINDLDEVPTTKSINLKVGKKDKLRGLDVCNTVKKQFQKQKVVVFQPFGAGAKLEAGQIIDDSGRSFELEDVYTVLNELGKYYALIVMSHLEIPADSPMPGAIPDNLGLLEWMAIIDEADYFLGCDSVGQHFAHAVGTPATIVTGSTFPENISYPDNASFTIIDNGKDKRIYSPLRLTEDMFINRNNENLMELDEGVIDSVIDSVKTCLDPGVLHPFPAGDAAPTPVKMIPKDIREAYSDDSFSKETSLNDLLDG